MTLEDLNQIRAIVHEECGNQIAASEQRMTDRMEALDRRTVERQERFMEAFMANLSDLRNEMNSRFETVDRRFEALERRLDRTSETLRSIDTRMGALTPGPTRSIATTWPSPTPRPPSDAPSRT